MSRKDRKEIAKREFDPSIDLDPTNLPKPWTIRQYFFALAYLADKERNATKAAIAAGFSKTTAKTTASRMMTSDNFKHVIQYIAHREQKAVNKYAYNHEKHIESVMMQANFNIFDFYSVDETTGELKIDWRKVPREMGVLIDAIETKSLSLKIVEGGQEIALPVMSNFVKFSDRTKAKDMINKMNNLYEKDNTRRLFIEGGEKPLQFEDMTMEQAAKAYQDALKEI